MGKALRGLEIVSIALGSVTLPPEDAELIKQAQRTAIMRDPTMAAAALAGAQADAMKAAAANEGGATTGFMGMGMAMNAGGIHAEDLFAMGQPESIRRRDGTAVCKERGERRFFGKRKKRRTTAGRCLDLRLRRGERQ